MSQVPPIDVTRTEPEAEISLGRELRRAREVRGISIEQIARETKINERYLHALESDRLDLLPGQLYARNFVRSVARTIGADEEELLDYFNYQVRLLDDRSATRDESRAGHAARRGVVLAATAAAAVLLVALLTFALRPSRNPEIAAPQPRTPRATVPATSPPPAAGALATPGQEGVSASEGDPTPPSAEPASAARPVPPILQPSQARDAGQGADPSAPGLVASPAGASAPAGTIEPAALPVPSLKLAFADASWVEIQRAGDGEPFVGMAQKGETMTYSLDRAVTLTILNSSGVAISVDGKPFRPLGGPQEKRTITVDRKNYLQYLKR